MNRRTTEFDLQAILAVTWVLSSILVTIAIGPELGLRGWSWLLCHHLVCIIACGHEFFRYRQRQALKVQRNQQG